MEGANAEPDNKIYECALASWMRRAEISLRRRESSDKREEVLFDETRNCECQARKRSLKRTAGYSGIKRRFDGVGGRGRKSTIFFMITKDGFGVGGELTQKPPSF